MSFRKIASARAAGFLSILFVAGAFAQTNGVLREVYYNVSGTAVANLTSAPNFPGRPNEEFIATAFEAPSNFADNYGQRMRALLVPPVTGSYLFWIASDDNSALYLSTDQDPAHKVQIASVTAWTDSRQWNTYPAQKSAAIALTNGFQYYLEALQKEGGGGDNLAVTWRKPGDAAPANGAPPIPGSYLVPYGVGPPIIAVQPTNVTVVEGGSATFTVQLAHYLGATFQWRRGGGDVPNSTNSYFLVAPAALSDSGATLDCRVTNPYGATNSSSATLTVTPDLTRPTLTSVGSLGDPQILVAVFSEPLERASATTPGRRQQETRSFGTTRAELESLAAGWLSGWRWVIRKPPP